MSSSPRLIVLLVCAIFFGCVFSRVNAFELTLTPNFQLPGLTFFNALTFQANTSTQQVVNIQFTQVEAINIIQQADNPTPTNKPIEGSENTSNIIYKEGLSIEEIIPTPTPTPTNTPTPTPTQAPIITSSDLETFFSKYAGDYSVDKELLKKIAKCESGFNSGANYLEYGGMFQFSPSSWSSTRQMMNLDPNPDLRYNAEESIKTAAFKISISGPSAWPSCH